MKTYQRVEIKLHVFLNSALDTYESSASFSCRFTLDERAPGTYWIGCQGPRTRMDMVPKRKMPALCQIENESYNP
jgi:hypothetical protein